MRDPLAHWSGDAWRSEVDAWVHGVLDDAGTPATGPGEQVKARFWSVVRRYPTTAEWVWFKECNPGQGFEPALAAVLARLVPDAFPEPLAKDQGRARLLLRDAGAVRSRDEGPLPEADLAGVLVRAAHVQLALVDNRGDLEAAGLPALTAAQVPAWAEALADDLASHPASDAQHMTADEHRRVRAGLPWLTGWCDALAGSGVPDTFQHDDLNPRNVAVAAQGDGPPRVRFLDVGDAFWSHPFAVVQVPLAMWTDSWPRGPDADDPRVRRVLDAYLDQWAGPGRPLPALRALVGPALLLAQAHRCESWRRLLAPVDPTRLGVPAPRLADYLLRVTSPD